jgi:predicted ester cyclase
MEHSSIENKSLIGRYLHALSGQPKTPDLIERFVSDSGLAEHVRDVEAAFPAYEIVAEELIAERGLVAMRGTFRGVHRGAFAGIPATGRSVSAALMIIYRIEADRIAEHWMQLDSQALMAQLTASPVAPAPTP